ncbi:hypothetical protein [Motilimonas eburnea]|uniref:hypothetical protein n=1 Tax=Motilimonas eburnea TaxID=1737488 RepID=UPI001E32E80E|nr:hypothetical protein [Motilimonas eburnea]MCE2571788.1 hypothetical protein [Motilimonas eburnea]
MICFCWRLLRDCVWARYLVILASIVDFVLILGVMNSYRLYGMSFTLSPAVVLGLIIVVCASYTKEIRIDEGILSVCHCLFGFRVYKGMTINVGSTDGIQLCLSGAYRDEYCMSFNNVIIAFFILRSGFLVSKTGEIFGASGPDIH